MVVKLTNQGDWLFSGYVTKNAVYKTVGEKDTPLCEFSVNCGKKENGDAIFVNCKAWRNLAGIFSELQKGDSFAGIGREKTREYKGKTYTDIELEWGNSPMICGDIPTEDQIFPPQTSQAPETAETGSSVDDGAEDDLPDFLRDIDVESCF